MHLYSKMTKFQNIIFLVEVAIIYSIFVSVRLGTEVKSSNENF